MKKFKVTVNGQSYEVEVEEMGGAIQAPVAAPIKVANATPVAPAAPTPQPAAPTPATSSAPIVSKGPVPEGATVIKAPMPGKISALKVVVGATVKRGDVIVVLEAMKMQNDIMAPVDGTVHEFRINVGDNVKTSDELVVITQ